MVLSISLDSNAVRKKGLTSSMVNFCTKNSSTMHTSTAPQTGVLSISTMAMDRKMGQMLLIRCLK